MMQLDDERSGDAVRLTFDDLANNIGLRTIEYRTYLSHTTTYHTYYPHLVF